jgi:hypothetical protein
VEERKEISYEIILHSAISPEKVTLITSNQSSIGKKMVFHPLQELHASSSIVSRSEWGADETLRYISPESRATKVAAWKERQQKPLIIEETSSEREYRIRSEQEIDRIFSSTPKSYSTHSMIRYEGSHKLFWPIQKSHQVDRIVLHHTAEALDKDADDATLIRAIYYYHTKTKRWGDI